MVTEHTTLVATYHRNRNNSEYFTFGGLTLMLEINPIQNQIKDLRERVDALRGYL
jgi:hypothetical protein